MMHGKSTVSGSPFRMLPLSNPDPRPADDGPVTLLRAIAAAGTRHKGKLAAWISLCLAAALIFARMTPPTYTAAATILLEPRRSVLSAARETVTPSSLDLNYADSELQVFRSERLLSTVFDALALAEESELDRQSPGPLQSLGGRLSATIRDGWASLAAAVFRVGAQGAVAEAPRAQGPRDDGALLNQRRSAFENFARRFSARRVGQSYVLEIAYSSSDPSLPARVANAAASAYLLQSVAVKANAARSGGELLQGRLDSLSMQVSAATAAVRGGILPSLPIPDADARVIGAAQAPLGPSAPRGSLIMAFGGVFGLLSGVFVAALCAAFDQRIRRPDDLMGGAGLPCLAIIPNCSVGRGSSSASVFDKAILVSDEQADAFAAAIRDLRTAIELAWAAGRLEGSPVVAIGSWKAGAGATLLTMHLAQLLRHRGRQVSVLSADPPEVGSEGSKDGSGGKSLADAIAGNAPPEQAPFTHIDGVRWLPLHSATPQINRYVDFRDQRAAQIVAHAKQRGDVLINLPPLDKSADAIALATHTDIVVLVAIEGVTTFDNLNEAIGSLHRAGSTVIGVVINRCRS